MLQGPARRVVVRPAGRPSGIVVSTLTVWTLLVAALLTGLPAVLAVGSAHAAACPAPGGSRIGPAAPPSGADLVVQGHGWGHSTGMSQYGAEGAARLGCDYATILRTYYTGADVVTRASMLSQVHLLLLDDGTHSTVQPQGGPLRWLDVGGTRAVTQPDGSTWQVVATSQGQELRDAAGTRMLAVPFGSELRVEQNGTVARVRALDGTAVVTDLRLRWDHTRFMSTSQGLDVRQVVLDSAAGPAVDKYLWGLAEVPASWPAGALKAQVVAGRTYLARRANTSGTAYVIGTTTSHQHYTGYAQEEQDARAGGHWRAAVNATTRQVLQSGSSLIDALYSSSFGGRSEDGRYVWGTDTSYLRSVDDSAWDLASSNPYRSWAKGFTHSELATAFKVDRVTSISLAARGTTARHAGATVQGVRGGSPVTLTYTGNALRGVLGLRSPGIASLTWVAPGKPVTGDWDRDGRDDVGWYRGGAFFLRNGDGSVRVVRFGREGDVPVIGDWDGDGSVGLGVFRNGQWYLRNALSEGPADIAFAYGSRGHVPVTGRWTGGRGAGVGVVIGNQWHLRLTPSAGSAQVVSAFGRVTDRPVAGDWDGNGTTTPGVVRGNQWYLSSTITQPTATAALAFGSAAYTPLAGDFDGDRRVTPAVVHNGSWYWRNDLAGGFATAHVVFVA